MLTSATVVFRSHASASATMPVSPIALPARSIVTTLVLSVSASHSIIMCAFSMAIQAMLRLVMVLARIAAAIANDALCWEKKRGGSRRIREKEKKKQEENTRGWSGKVKEEIVDKEHKKICREEEGK